MAGTGLFDGLSDRQRAGLIDAMAVRRLRRGDVLVREGDGSSDLFLVRSGRFTASVAGRGEPIADLAPGEFIGEIGFFAGLPRTATVVAARDSVVLVLDREGFAALAGDEPDLYRQVLAALARRLADTTRRLPDLKRPAPSRTAVLLPVGIPGPLWRRFRERLTAIFRGRPKTLFIGEHDGPAAGFLADPAAFPDWLNEIEADLDLVIFVGDADLTAWNDLILRHADQLVLVGEGEPCATLSPAEQLAFALVEVPARRFVRLHETRDPLVSGTARWLETRPVGLVHHVAVADDKDIESLWRFLTGRATGFVAGGGGAFGPAHSGIYKAFTERGFVFDMVGGTSVGAALAAGMAFLLDGDQLEAGIEDIFVTSRAFRRMTVPRYSLLEHLPLDRALRRVYRGLDLEDLWKPFFAVATDLTTNKMRILQRGPLWQAIRASGSIPGALPPMFTQDRHMLVDGAIVDNVPLDVMKQLKRGPNLVVDLNAKGERLYEVDYDNLPGRRALLAALVNPFRRQSLPLCPNPIALMQQAMMANGDRYAHLEGPDDLVLRPPPFPGSSFMNWDRHRDVFAGAYGWARETIDRLSGADCGPLAALRAASAAPEETPR